MSDTQEQVNTPTEERPLTPAEKQRMKVIQAVQVIDRICEAQKLTTDEALWSFMVVTAITLSKMNRNVEVQFLRNLDKEIKHQRRLQMKLPPKDDARIVSVNEAASMSQEAVDEVTEAVANGSV